MHGVASENASKGLVIAAVVGGLMASDGLFGLILALVFHMIHNER